MSQWNICGEELLSTYYKDEVKQIKSKIGITKLKEVNSINKPRRWLQLNSFILELNLERSQEALLNGIKNT